MRLRAFLLVASFPTAMAWAESPPQISGNLEAKRQQIAGKFSPDAVKHFNATVKLGTKKLTRDGTPEYGTDTSNELGSNTPSRTKNYAYRRREVRIDEGGRVLSTRAHYPEGQMQKVNQSWQYGESEVRGNTFTAKTTFRVIKPSRDRRPRDREITYKEKRLLGGLIRVKDTLDVKTAPPTPSAGNTPTFVKRNARRIEIGRFGFSFGRADKSLPKQGRVR